MSPRVVALGVGIFLVSTVASAQGPAEEAPRAQPAPRRPAGPAPKVAAAAAGNAQQAARVDALLAEWEKRSRSIQTLDAKFKRIDVKAGPFKGRTAFQGRALLQAPNLACLELHKIDPEDKTKKTFHERIVCTGDEVDDFVGAERIVNVYPLPKDQQQKALQEGPLPFLFDMKAKEVKARYQIVLEEEGADAYRLRIAPREDIDRDAFSVARVNLNKTTFLPDALQLVDATGKETQTYLFKDENGEIVPNKEIAASNFQRGKVPQGWKVVVNPPADQPAAAGAANANAPAPAAAGRFVRPRTR